MKRTIKKLTKMQRKTRSKRKTRTKAEKFQLRNERAMRENNRLLKELLKLEKQFKEQAAAERATVDDLKEPVADVLEISPELPE
jgi:hypothetical protein